MKHGMQCNISEKDRAKDQFDDILRTFTNEMNKFENRFGKIRDEEKMFAVKKWMPESLLNCRFRGTSYSELIVALENIIVDKVVTVPTVRSRKHDTRVLQWRLEWQRRRMERMRAKKETKGSWTSLCRPSTKELAKESWALARVRTGMRRVAKAARMEEKTIGRKAVARKEAKGKRKAVRETPERAGRAARQDTLQLGRKGGSKNLYAIDEDCSENAEESAENEEDLQAWCILEESENEQWQEVISRRSKQRMKKVNQASLLSVESSHSSSPKKIVEVKDKWVKVRVTMDSGAAGYVMSETMCPHVKLERKTSAKKFVAANGEQIKDLGEKSIPFKTIEGVQRCIAFRSANVVKPLISMQNVVRAGNIVVLDDKNPHIRNTRDGAMIKLDVNNGVYTMDMCICLDETGPVFSWQGQ